MVSIELLLVGCVALVINHVQNIEQSNLSDYGIQTANLIEVDVDEIGGLEGISNALKTTYGTSSVLKGYCNLKEGSLLLVLSVNRMNRLALYISGNKSTIDAKFVSSGNGVFVRV